MAVSMAATLAVPGTTISGQKFTCSLSLTESGGTNTNLVSIQPFLLNSGGGLTQGCRFGTVANAATIAGYTGAAVTINANSTSIFNFECVIDSPDMWKEGVDGVNGNYYLGATCQTSDGSVFGPQPQIVGVATPQSGIAGSASPAPNGLINGAVILGTTTNQYNNVLGGAARFDISANDNLLSVLF